MKLLSENIEFIKAKINQSSLSRRLFEGISWTLIGNVVGKFLQLLAFIFVARLVGKEEYGQISIIRSTLNMFLIFSSAGMGVTATRYIAMYRTSNPHRAYEIYRFTQKTVIWIGLIISVLVFLLSSYIAENQLNDLRLSDALKIGAVILFLMTLTSIQFGTLNGFEQFKKVGINSALNGVIQLISVVLGAYLWGINGVIIGLGITSLILVIQLWFSLKKDISQIRTAEKNKDEEKFDSSSIFLKFSLPAVLQGLVVIPVLWWSKTYLIDNAGYGEMATFDVAEQWYYVVLFIPGSLGTILLPLLTNTNYNGSKQQYNKLLKINMLINVGVTFIIAVAVAFFSPLIYKFYGKEFTDYHPLLILLVTVVICAANNVLGQVITSKGKMWTGFGLNGLWALWLVLFSFIFIGKYQLGAVGLAYAMLISYLLHSIAQAYLAFRMKQTN